MIPGQRRPTVVKTPKAPATVGKKPKAPATVGKKPKAPATGRVNNSKNSKNSSSKNSKESNRYKIVRGELVPIGYTLRSVPRDGDCLYHAVSRAIGATYTNNKFDVPKPAHFREELQNFIEESTTTLTMFDITALNRIGSGGWGEDYEVQKIVDMISKKYTINFCIHMFNAKNGLRDSHRWQFFSQQYSGECDHIIYLHNSGNSRDSEHFQYMMPSVTHR